MVNLKVKFTCDKCGSEKMVDMNMNYKLYQERIEYGHLPEKLYLPNGWAYEELTKNKYAIMCKKCGKKWMKQNDFVCS